MTGRRLGSLERVWQAARAMDRSFSLQLVLELDRALDRATWEQALVEVGRHNPLVGCRTTGVLGWTRWTPGEVRPRVLEVWGGAWSGDSLKAAAFLEGPLEQPVELLLVEGQVPRVVLRCDHALVDGIGILGLVRDLFDVLGGRTPGSLPLGTSDLELARSLRRTPAPAPPVDVGSPLGPPRSDSPHRSWFARRAPLHDRLMARVVRATWRASRRWTDRPLRVDVPVDLRRHGAEGSGNLTGLVQLTLHEEPSLDEVHERLNAALAERAELDPVLRMAVARWLPVAWLAGLGRAGAERSYSSDDWQSSVTLSHLGRHDLTGFGGPSVQLRRLVPVAPSSRGLPLNLTFLADREGVELSASAPAAVGGEGRLADFLADLADALG